MGVQVSTCEHVIFLSGFKITILGAGMLLWFLQLSSNLNTRGMTWCEGRPLVPGQMNKPDRVKRWLGQRSLLIMSRIQLHNSKKRVCCQDTFGCVMRYSNSEKNITIRNASQGHPNAAPHLQAEVRRTRSRPSLTCPDLCLCGAAN